ncbi:MAG: helix-turn-helix domain-containing protein [Pedobacter sp.]|nr:MAG: helix-turn-helix domain-containing protein [Pedobacter sp.]
MILRIQIKESEEKLKELMKYESDASRKDKLTSLYLIKTNKVLEIKDLVSLLNRHRNTISSWLEMYRKKGLNGLLKEKAKITGRPSLIKGKVLESLIEKLSNPDGFKSYLEIQSWLKNEHNLEIEYYTVHHTVRYKLKSKLKVVRPSNIKKDKDKEIAFKKTL